MKKYIKNEIMTTRVNDEIMQKFVDACKDMGVQDKSKAIHYFMAKVITREWVLDPVDIKNTLSTEI